jgi:hypothetical protein
MAKSKGASSSSRKITFGKRKRGKAKKSFNKHDSRSTYHRRNASR